MNPLVSCVTPTGAGREHQLSRVRRSLLAQRFDGWEWIIADDATTPNPEARAWAEASPSRIRYVHLGRGGPRLSLGEKRNLLVDLARARLVAHIDDDDLYSPEYLARMTAPFASKSVELVKLGDWICEQHGLFYRWDTSLLGVQHLTLDGRFAARPASFTAEEQRLLQEDCRVGFGFSYVYRRSFALKHRFPPANWSEDTPLGRAAQTAGGLWLEHDGVPSLAVHAVHPFATGRSYPTEELTAAEVTRCLGWVDLSLHEFDDHERPTDPDLRHPDLG